MAGPDDDAEAVLVVGAGISGLAAARALRAADVPVRVVDRGRAPGGRMGGRTLAGRPVDLGASYLTAEPGSRFDAVVQDWVARGLAHPWTDTFAVAGPEGLRSTTTGPVRYGSAGGLRSLVADLADGLDVTPGRTVERVTTGGTEHVSVDGVRHRAVVLAMPDAQARRLVPDGSPTAAALDARPAWEPVVAVALGYDRRAWSADLHGAFVHDSDVLSFVADDGDRRGDGAPVLVAHTTAELAAAHLADPTGAVGPVVAALTAMLGLPEPAWTHAHRWTFARPAEPTDALFELHDGIGVCGDGWAAKPSVQGAWSSGDALARGLAC